MNVAREREKTASKKVGPVTKNIARESCRRCTVCSHCVARIPLTLEYFFLILRRRLRLLGKVLASDERWSHARHVPTRTVRDLFFSLVSHTHPILMLRNTNSLSLSLSLTLHDKITSPSFCYFPKTHHRSACLGLSLPLSPNHKRNQILFQATMSMDCTSSSYWLIMSSMSSPEILSSSMTIRICSFLTP
jgi:hypothetical protein